ncbi:uncharacterized protein LOC116919387 isoform X1 [Daphnia magna]|nr:uncharacterized protein LOC116919387 isoform X1 [Daphnia magna]
MKRGDKQCLALMDAGKWISSLFTSYFCPWFLPSRSATPPRTSTSVDVVKSQPNDPVVKMKGTMTRGDLTLNWTHHDSDLPDFCFHTIQQEDVSQVSDFLLKYFFPEEPLGQSLKLDPNEEVRPWLPKMLEHEIREGLSIVVRRRSASGEESTSEDVGEVVAVCLNDVERTVSDAEDVNIFSFVTRDSQPNMWKITRVLDELVAEADLFNCYQIEALVSCQMLCVDPRFGGRGLAQKLIRLTEDLTRTMDYSLIISEATSEFSARAFLKAGFHCQKTLPYDTFAFDDGEQPFRQLASTSVHKTARLMVKYIK